MFYILGTITILPCTLPPDVMLRLDDARAVAAEFREPTPVASWHDPLFDNDHPIVIEVLPLPRPRLDDLTIAVTHWEAMLLPGSSEVAEVMVVDLISVSPRGVLTTHMSCDARISQVSLAIDAMLAAR